MKINKPFFLRKLPLTVERDNLYLGEVYNNNTEFSERKILCTSLVDCVEDVLFEAPHYSLTEKEGYTVKKTVTLGLLLKYLGYPEKLNARDIRRIYNQILSSTEILHKYYKIFGVVRVREGYMRKYAYWPSLNCSSALGYEDFCKLESLISLPTVPSELEREDERYSFQKRLFFIP